jgi:hypothetical protein
MYKFGGNTRTPRPEIDGVDDQDIILSLINRYDELINPNTIDYNYDD